MLLFLTFIFLLQYILKFRIYNDLKRLLKTKVTLYFPLPCKNCNHFLLHLQSIITLDGSALIQVQKWDGKSTTIKRKRVDDKLVVVSMF